MSEIVHVDAAATSATELAAMLVQGKRLECGGFNFSAEQRAEGEVPDVWVTNPYGVDCAMYPATEEGCRKLMQMVESWVDYGEASQLMEVV